MPNAFGGGFVTGVVDAIISVAAEGASLASSPPINFLTPMTDHAVVKSVNKKPPMITVNSLSTSKAFPKPLANGSVIKLGTKNTGNHFANKAAPGVNTSYTLSPHLFLSLLLNASSASIDAKSAPHPAKDDGNGMEYFWNNARNCVSSRIKIVVAMIVLLLPVEEDEVADAAA